MPRYGSEVHRVKHMVGPLVEDTRGRRFEVKLVAPVPQSSADQEVPSELRGGNPALMARQKAELRIYADKLAERLRDRGTISIQEASSYMYQFVIGWREVMREERLIGKNAFTRWLQLYPDKFEIIGSGARSRVRLR